MNGEPTMICVIAKIQVAQGRREELLAELHRIVPKVREEEGCLEYGPMVHVPTNIAAQVAPQDDVVTVVEKWESVEALEAHLMAPHMLEYRKTVKPLVVSTSLEILRPA
jgi:quinol monooxygenase YgiN